MLETHADSISDFEQVLGKLADSKLLFVVDHLSVSLHGVLILLNLLCVFDSHELDLFGLPVFLRLELVKLLLEALNLGFLLIKQLFDLLYIFF